MILSKPNKSLLFRILADLDALWLPVRRWPGESRETADAVVAIYERRDAIRTEGLPLVIGGTERNRQSGHRELRGLVSRGYVRVLGSGKNRGVMLTPLGENVARSMAPTKRVDESWKWLLAIADTMNRVVDSEPGYGYHVLETDIVGVDGPADVLEDECLPLLSAGLVDAHSDGAGRLGYTVTKRGLAAIAQGEPAKPRGMPKYDPADYQEFVDLYNAALDGRERWKPRDGNSVVIPLSCGSWPEVRSA